jgi:hypothetical protein
MNKITKHREKKKERERQRKDGRKPLIRGRVP